jgi:hypothetical protein
MILVTVVGDQRISQIEKIFVKKWPKFLDLYASIYGNFNDTNSKFGFPLTSEIKISCYTK